MGDYGYSNGYSSTTYGANGDANGGGFMTGGSQEQTRKNYNEETLRPVTIKQVLDADTTDGEAFKLDGQPLTQVTFVGQIRNVSSQTTMHTYKLDDGTSTVEVKQWTDPEAMGLGDDEPAGSKPMLSEGVYARVFGQVKSFSNKRFVSARPGGLRAVTDHNEVQTHLLEATVVHLHLTLGPPGQQGDEAKGGAGDAGGQANGAGQSLPAGLSAGARRVYACLQKVVQTREGLHAQDIAARLGMDPGEVEHSAAELVNLGLTYSTSDEQTWAVLEMF